MKVMVKSQAKFRVKHSLKSSEVFSLETATKCYQSKGVKEYLGKPVEPILTKK